MQESNYKIKLSYLGKGCAKDPSHTQVLKFDLLQSDILRSNLKHLAVSRQSLASQKDSYALMDSAQQLGPFSGFRMKD